MLWPNERIEEVVDTTDYEECWAYELKELLYFIRDEYEKVLELERDAARIADANLTGDLALMAEQVATLQAQLVWEMVRLMELEGEGIATEEIQASSMDSRTSFAIFIWPKDGYEYAVMRRKGGAKGDE